MRVSLHDVSERRMWDAGDLAGCERANGVVHLTQQEAVQVHNVAGNVKRQDLPPAVLQELVAAREALQDCAAMEGAVAVEDDVLVGTDVSGGPEGADERLLLLLREGGEGFNLSDDW